MACSTAKPACLPAQKRGDTWTFVFNWKQSNGAPVDLSGCTARMQLRGKYAKTVAAEPDDLVIDALTGKVTATFAAATTSTVAPGTYYTDLELTYADGTVQSSATVELLVLEDITLPPEGD